MLLFGMVVAILLGKVTVEATGDAICENCIRGKVVQPCGGCSGNAHVDVFEAEGELFSLSRPQEIDGSVVCSAINNGIEYEMLKERVKKIIQLEKKRPKSIWPCLNFEPPAHLSGLKAVILNIALCHQYLQPLIDQMYKKFSKKNESATDIFTWLKTELRTKWDQEEIADYRFWFWMNHVLDWLVVNMKDMEAEDFETLYGKKCMKSFTKRCRCI